MPLNPATLTAEILKLTDPSNANFVGFPPSNVEVAANWAAAAKVFFLEMVVPPVLPAVHVAAEAAFNAAMAALLGPPGAVTAAPALAAGFTQYAVTVAAGAVPPVAVPPPAPLVIPIGPPIADPTIPAANIATAVFAWTKTGLYGVPPAPPSVPWS